MNNDELCCEQCNFKTNLKSTFKNHNKSKVHLRLFNKCEKYKEYKFHCEICYYGTNNKRTLEKHNVSKLHRHRTNINFEKNNCNFDYRCFECKYMTKSTNSFSQHKRTKKHLKNLKEEKKEGEKKQQITNDNSQHAHTINNNTTNNNTYNDNRTINVNYYGEENIKNVIDFDTYIKINELAHSPQEALEFLLDKLYIETKENNNVIYTNLRSNKCKVLTENGYKTMLCDDVMKDRSFTTIKIPRLVKGMFNSPEQDFQDYFNAYEQLLSIHPFLTYPFKYKSITHFKESENKASHPEGISEIKDYKNIKDRHFGKIYDLTKNNK